MKRILAIALFLATVFFAASAVLSLGHRKVVHGEDIGAYDESILPWTYAMGAALCLGLGIWLWREPGANGTGRTTPVEKGGNDTARKAGNNPIGKGGPAVKEETLDIKDQDEHGRNGEGKVRAERSA